MLKNRPSVLCGNYSIKRGVNFFHGFSFFVHVKFTDFSPMFSLMFSFMFSPMFSHVFSPMPSHYSPNICSTQCHASDCGHNWPYDEHCECLYIRSGVADCHWAGLCSNVFLVVPSALGKHCFVASGPSAWQWAFLWQDLHIHLMRLFTHVVGQCWKMTRSRESHFFFTQTLLL